MTKFITVTTFYEQHPALIAGQHGDATRHGHQAMGELWKGQLASEHFDPRARFIFGYQQRTAKYRKRKIGLARIGKAEDGGMTDLVLTGRSRRLVKNATVAATANKTTITHFMPSYFGKRRSARAPDTRKELLAVSPRQEKLLSEAGARAYRERLRRIPASLVTKTH